MALKWLQRHSKKDEQTEAEQSIEARDVGGNITQTVYNASVTYQTSGGITVTLPRAPVPVEQFTGHETDLEALSRELQSSKNAAIVTGLGGIGKTEFARAFAQRYFPGHAYALIFSGSFRNTFQNFVRGYSVTTADGKQLTGDDHYSLILGLLANGETLKRDDLLIIDNVTDLQDAEDALSLPCHVLFTTRLSCDAVSHGNCVTFPLPLLFEEECVGLFEKYYVRAVENRGIVTEIVRKAGRHTLTIELLAKTCRAAHISQEEMLQRIRDKGFTLEDIPEKVLRSNDTENKTFLEHMVKLFDVTGICEDEEMRHVLKNLCVLDLNGFDIRTLKEWLELDNYNPLNRLIELGWLSEEDDRVTMHNIMSEMIRYQLKPEFADVEKLAGHLADALKAADDYAKTPYTDSAEVLLTAIPEKQEILGRIAHSTGWLYNHQGRYDEALKYYQQALAIFEQVLGKNHPYTATSYNNIGLVYDSQGKYEEALEHYQKALAIKEQVLGKNHPSTATSYNNIGSVYYSQGKYEKALENYQQALAICEQVLGKNHPSTATNYNNIGLVYSSQGKYDEALKYYQQALAICEQVLGKNHPYTATSYNNIGLVYSSQGRYDEALENYQQALAICEQVLGKNHPNTATSYNNIGSVYDSQGKYEEALEYCQQALAIREQVLGEKHPYTITAYGNIAEVYLKKGDFGNALKYARKAGIIKDSEQE